MTRAGVATRGVPLRRRRMTVIAGLITCIFSIIGSTVPASASCVFTPLDVAFRFSKVVFVGRALPGPTVGGSGPGSLFLVTPARVRVDHYVKGSGPAEVKVETGVISTSGGRFSMLEDGIFPRAGDWFVIYFNETKNGVIQTSGCSASRKVHGPDVVVLGATGSQTRAFSIIGVVLILAGIFARNSRSRFSKEAERAETLLR